MRCSVTVLRKEFSLPTLGRDWDQTPRCLGYNGNDLWDPRDRLPKALEFLS